MQWCDYKIDGRGRGRGREGERERLGEVSCVGKGGERADGEGKGEGR